MESGNVLKNLENNFFCGGCKFSAASLLELHAHLTQHYEGGNYFYYHFLRTAFPKHDYICNESLTCDELSACRSTQTEIDDVLSEHVDDDSVAPADSQSKLTTDVNSKVFQDKEVECFDRDVRILQMKKETNELDAIESNDKLLEVKVEVCDDSVDVDDEFQGMDSSTDDYSESDFEEYLPYTKTKRKSNGKKSSKRLPKKSTKSIKNNTKKQTKSCAKTGSNTDKQSKNTLRCPPTTEEKMITDYECLKTKRKYKQKKSKISQDVHSDIEKLTANTGEFNEGNNQTIVKARMPESAREMEEENELKRLSSHSKKLGSLSANETTKKMKTNGSSKHLNGSFKCALCEKSFSNIKLLSAHVESNHYETYPYRCLECSLIYRNETDASTHDCGTAKKLNHVCELCPKPKCFRFVDHITKHLKEEHDCEFPFSCDQCDLKFVSDFHLKCHKPDHDSSLLCCSLCKKKLISYSNLVSHLMFHQKEHVCDRCGKGYVNRDSFKYHKWACTGKFACLECNKTFCSNTNLKCHMLIHSGEKPIICELCGQSFRGKDGLKSHKKYVHSEVKDYKCGQCEKTFTARCTLQRHERVHSKIRPFSCEFCNKQFSTNWNLKAHMRQHNGTKPYVCSVCGLGFAHNVARKKHEAKCAN